MLVTEFDHDETRRIASDDLHAAKETRREIEEVKRRVFQSYETWTSKITGGGKKGETEGGAGEFGWSKIEVPMVYWVVETEIPRLALGAPTLIASAMSPEAVAYQHAKTLRLQEQMRRAKARPAIFRSVKRMSLYGLGPMLWWWNAHEQRIAVTDVSWFDFWISPGARHWLDAECLWVRSWFTPRQARRMAKQKDAHGKPLYMNLEELADQPVHPESEEPIYSQLREAAGEGQEVFTEGGMVPLYTGYYDDGSIVMLGGPGYQTLVQARETPFWRVIPKRLRFGPDDSGRRPYRPIACLSNTPNTETPYPHGSGEVVLNYQEELSTFRRQAMDQATAHLNAPVIYDKAAVGEGASAKIAAAFGVPGGMLGVNGGTDVRSVVMRMAPGQLPFDVVNTSDMYRQESQLVTGISDYVAGQANMLGSNTTATAVERITDEANMRWRFKNAIIEDDMQVAAMIVDYLDKQFGTEVFTNKGDDARGDVDGVKDHGSGLLQIGMDPNKEECEYDIKIEAGSLTPPSQTQEINDLMAMVNMLAVAEPMMAMVKWSELAKEIVGRLGLEPDRVLLSDDEQMMSTIAAQAGPGEEPVGDPIPVEGGVGGA